MAFSGWNNFKSTFGSLKFKNVWLDSTFHGGCWTPYGSVGCIGSDVSQRLPWQEGKGNVSSQLVAN